MNVTNSRISETPLCLNHLFVAFLLSFVSFVTPFYRIVSLGDVVTMSTKEFPEYTQDISEGVHTRSPFVFFKVIMIEPMVDGAVSYTVDSMQTSVFQVKT